jgi:diadenosine tetraphosphate (Ap4A) HIT family hydrolase
VFHLHFHLLPRVEGVGLAGHGAARRADDAEINELARKIAASM